MEIKNRRSRFEYHISASFSAGIALTGTEVKSIRDGKAGLVDSYCYFFKEELYIKNMYIAEYKLGTHNNHDPRRLRKLLLNRSELKKLQTKVKERGFTIVPLRIFLSEKGLIKLEIALAQGKKTYDKRQSIKAKDLKREMDRSDKG
jgi:SsrA-binding protein